MHEWRGCKSKTLVGQKYLFYLVSITNKWLEVTVSVNTSLYFNMLSVVRAVSYGGLGGHVSVTYGGVVVVL